MFRIASSIRFLISVVLIVFSLSMEASPSNPCSGLAVQSVEVQNSIQTAAPEFQRLILVPWDTSSSTSRDSFHADHASTVKHRFPRFGGMEIIDCRLDRSLEDLIALYEASGLYEIVEPDNLIYASVVPNDPRYSIGSLWHLSNTGQSGGLADADIDAPEAWGLNTGTPSVVIAVIDSGVRYTHQDLEANMWVNPDEIADNGIDDDLNGYVDDVYGIDAVLETGDPNDVNGHGTHVSGIIAAEGNNALGVVGVTWCSQIMALRFMDAEGSGSTSDAIECIDYALDKKARVINASWGSSETSRSLERAMRQVEAAGVVFVAAAGNDSRDIDSEPQYPASYTLSNIITVAASTRNDELSSYSNYGAECVLLAAPGDSIVSTWFSSDTSYASSSGTSMAAPVVAGIVAHLCYLMPSADASTIVALIAGSVDPLSAFSVVTSTGGRANLYQALKATGYFDRLNGSFVSDPTTESFGSVEFSEAVTGLTYRIEKSDDLSTWTLVGSAVADSDGFVKWVLDADPTVLFFRISPSFD